MKVFKISLLLGLATLWLSSCQLQKSEPVPQVYPEPTIQERPVGAVLYPDAKSGDQVAWEQAVAMILNGEVSEVMQTHSLKVTLTLKDGRVLHTVEPSIDDVFKVIQQCGEKCSNIMVATE